MKALLDQVEVGILNRLSKQAFTDLDPIKTDGDVVRFGTAGRDEDVAENYSVKIEPAGPKSDGTIHVRVRATSSEPFKDFSMWFDDPESAAISTAAVIESQINHYPNH